MYGGCSYCGRPCVILVPVNRHMGEMSSSTGLSGVGLDCGEAELELEVAALHVHLILSYPVLQHCCTNNLHVRTLRLVSLMTVNLMMGKPLARYYTKLLMR